jgi:large subunit ribosomal protein L10
MIKEEHIPEWKLEEVDNLVEMFEQNKNIAVLQVANINDRQIQEIRKILRGKAVIRMSKKNLQKRAIEKFKKKSKKKNLDELAKNIPGQSSLCFTNTDLFELKNIFEENEWMVPAKPNEVTPVDIIVPAGDTGLPTGQVISELNMTLRLPTLIKNDTIWIKEDKMTHKAGTLVTVKQAAVLKKLGVKPIESLIKIHFAWSEGEIIPADVLYMDLEQFQKDFARAHLTAQQLAIELGVVDNETIEPFLQKGYREAVEILFELPIFEGTMIDDYIRRASSTANFLNAMILGEGVKAPTKEKEPKSEPEPEEEEEEEVTGLGSLF